MKVRFLPSFIADLQQQAEPNFARRVFSKLFDGNGRFRSDTDDHRYHGIQDAWIRYVSQGKSAFRVIYIRDGEQVQLYRAGPHSVEDNLSPPSSMQPAAVVKEVEIIKQDPSTNEPGDLICSLRTPALWQRVHSRRLVPHKEVVLVSPFLSPELLTRTAKFGKLLDDWIEDGSTVILITKPPAPELFAVFADLEARGVELFFHERLHSKLYMFEVDYARVLYNQNYSDLYVLGSANLTQRGFYWSRDEGNEELCYQMPRFKKNDLDSYVASLAIQSKDLAKIKLENAQSMRRKNR